MIVERALLRHAHGARPLDESGLSMLPRSSLTMLPWNSGSGIARSFEGLVNGELASR